MRFEDLLKKPLHEMDDNELEQFVRELEEVRIKTLEEAAKRQKRNRRLKAEDVYEGISL